MSYFIFYIAEHVHSVLGIVTQHFHSVVVSYIVIKYILYNNNVIIQIIYLYLFIYTILYNIIIKILYQVSLNTFTVLSVLYYISILYR